MQVNHDQLKQQTYSDERDVSPGERCLSKLEESIYRSDIGYHIHDAQRSPEIESELDTLEERKSKNRVGKEGTGGVVCVSIHPNYLERLETRSTYNNLVGEETTPVNSHSPMEHP